jgi:hypothetical protein
VLFIKQRKRAALGSIALCFIKMSGCFVKQKEARCFGGHFSSRRFVFGVVCVGAELRNVSKLPLKRF